MSNEPTKDEGKSDRRSWSHRKGTVDPASIVENEKGGVDAVVKSEAGKEYKVSTYAHSAHATDKIRKAAESGEPHTFSGDLLGAGDKVFVGVRNVTGPAIPKKENTADAEKPATEKAAPVDMSERDKTRTPVPADFNGETLAVGDKEVAVTGFGREFEVDEKGVAALKERFGADFKVGDKVKYASFAAPEADAAPEGP